MLLQKISIASSTGLVWFEPPYPTPPEIPVWLHRSSYMYHSWLLWPSPPWNFYCLSVGWAWLFSKPQWKTVFGKNHHRHHELKFFSSKGQVTLILSKFTLRSCPIAINCFNCNWFGFIQLTFLDRNTLPTGFG